MTKIKTTSLEDIKKEIDPDEEILDLRGQVGDLNERLKQYKRDHGSLKTFFRDLKECISPIQPIHMEYAPPEKKTKVSNPISPVFQISDVHMGMQQDPDEIEGFNEYNPEICVNRSMFYMKQGVEWVELHRSNYTINEARVICTGDNISGDIHRELSITNAFPTPVQVVKAAVLIADQISYLSPHFSNVVVDFISEDNHSRLTKKPQSKQAGYNSLNYLVGFIAKERLKLVENVTFNLWPMLQKVINVQGRRYLITHGHSVRGWAGFPWYGLDRKVGREAIKRMKAGKHMFDTIVSGHFHTPLTTPGWMLGGSVSGTDAYDHKNARYSPPSQSAWLVHKKWGEFDRTDFDLRGADANVV
jgi:hypothetical protein